MTTPADNNCYRVQICPDGTNDDGDEQMIQCTGRFEERLGDDTYGVPRGQCYGMTTVLPDLSKLTMTANEGNLDFGRTVNGENAKCRPRGLPKGDIKWYDAKGNYCHAKVGGAEARRHNDPKAGTDGEWEWNVSGVKMTMKDGVCTIKADTIILDGFCILGGPSASRAVAAIGTTDDDDEMSGPDALISNLLTRVVGV